MSYLCLNSSKSFPIFFYFFLLTVISDLGFGIFVFDIFSFDDNSFGISGFGGSDFGISGFRVSGFG